MDLMIISNYWHFECEKSSSRYLSVADMASDAGEEVEVVTSSFYHTAKEQRTLSKSILESYKYKTTLIYEPGYRKNIDPLRVLSHKKFSINVINYIKQRKKPDTIYMFSPPINLAFAVVEYSKKHNIRIIIDVLDLWPEAYNMLTPSSLRWITKFLLGPMKKKADYVYRNANDAIAVSQTYADRINCVRGDDAFSVYIGIDMKTFDSAYYKIERSKNLHTLVYIGMLGKSYDIKCAIDAINHLNRKDIKLLVMGDGPLREVFEKYANQKHINYEFTGRLPYAQMIQRLVNCDIALNVITSGAVQSIINKHADYLAAGLPVISNQEIAEFGDLLEEYQCGINCKNGDYVSLAKAIIRLIDNSDLMETMGKNARKLAIEKFDRDKTYIKIIDLIKKRDKNEITSSYINYESN
ncbi:MAG: glycosyltransferase family 4 protein [Oscillospiraceae bacterium]|nr:glycosyltransferase family 4 protein [Oscillospiraceae bacterium]